MPIDHIYGFGGRKRRSGKSTASDPLPTRQRGIPDPQGDRRTAVGVDYGSDIDRMGTPRSYDEIAKSSGRPKTDMGLKRSRGGRREV